MPDGSNNENITCHGRESVASSLFGKTCGILACSHFQPVPWVCACRGKRSDQKRDRGPDGDRQGNAASCAGRSGACKFREKNRLRKCDKVQTGIGVNSEISTCEEREKYLFSVFCSFFDIEKDEKNTDAAGGIPVTFSSFDCFLFLSLQYPFRHLRLSVRRLRYLFRHLDAGSLYLQGFHGV